MHPPGRVAAAGSGAEPEARRSERPPARSTARGSGRFGGWCRSSAEVVVFEAVAVALERDQLGVVDEAVDHRGSGGVVAEDLAPGGEGLVGGDDQRGTLV